MNALDARIAKMTTSQIEDALRVMHSSGRVMNETSRFVWMALCSAFMSRSGDDAFDALMDEIGA